MSGTLDAIKAAFVANWNAALADVFFGDERPKPGSKRPWLQVWRNAGTVPNALSDRNRETGSVKINFYFPLHPSDAAQATEHANNQAVSEALFALMGPGKTMVDASGNTIQFNGVPRDSDAGPAMTGYLQQNIEFTYTKTTPAGV